MIATRFGASPFLRKIETITDEPLPRGYPFDVPAFKEGIALQFDSPVTFFVGANGSGKSTLLEALADKCNFNIAGGNRNHSYESSDAASTLARYIRVGWMPKVAKGFFFRAESFFNFATYVDGLPSQYSYFFDEIRGSLHDQSHGETFLGLFKNRFDEGIYILDEPEAALSPGSQLAFMTKMHRMEQTGNAQFIIATHSPMLICYPGATVYSFTGEGLQRVDYRETEHYKLTKEFLNDPERYLHYLFKAVEGG